ncbi:MULTISPECIES: TetR/AcrR family transcriptional regulator [unclassified Nocardia]|uniref:TetR/AcrR family transcriptional regulator n=1 Tax=unclassified Nocardia TaxID=2637762 RepID=UPI001CE3C897|nr:MULTISPECIES: TetR/AcrR family transcriptional regulator [unclassified Nocardia]
MVVRDASDTVAAGGSTKLAIRDAAVKLFGSKGFEQTSLREVADAVGITKASLYYHYASKLDLLQAIIDPIIDHLRTIVDDLPAIVRDDDGVRTVLRRHLHGMLSHRAAGALIVRDTVAIVNAMADRHPDFIDTTEVLREWLAGPNASEEARLRAAGALEVVGMALVSGEFVPNATDQLIEDTLLDMATGVLIPCHTA